MSLLPLADCARLLGIHPKTLRQWLKQDAQPLSAHPRDARIKCLTAQQIEQLAAAHNRSLPSESERQPKREGAWAQTPPSQEVLTSPPGSKARNASFSEAFLVGNQDRPVVRAGSSPHAGIAPGARAHAREKTLGPGNRRTGTGRDAQPLPAVSCSLGAADQK
jgi:hypothetical protein